MDTPPVDSDPAFGQPPLPTVQLRHDLPGGLPHVDWLIAQDSAGRLPLVSFRLDGRIDLLEPGQTVVGRRRPDHRPLYLEYEGPISGGRGSVTRLCAGTVLQCRHIADAAGQPAWEMQIRWENPADHAILQDLRLTRQNLANWAMFCVSIRRCHEAQ